MQTFDLDDLLINNSSGFLQLGGARMALLDVEAGFWGIRRQIETLIGECLTNSVFEQAGANGGASFAQSFVKPTAKEKSAAFTACLQAYQAAGFGQFEINFMQWPLGRIQIDATNAFEAWMMGQNNEKPQTPVCAYTAGVLVGFVNIIGERQDVVCIEHTCQARGDAACSFELLPAAQAVGQAVVSYTPDPGLSRQLNLLEILFERMPMGIAIIDCQYRIQRFNPTWEDYSIRYAPPDGDPLVPGVGYFEHLPGTESTVIPLFETVLKGETIRQNSVRLDLDGMATYWDIVLAPLFEDNEVTGILIVTVDATEREEIRLNLEQRVETRTREIERRRQVAEGLRDILVVLNSSHSLETILQQIVTQAVKLLGATSGVVDRLKIDSGQLMCQARYQTPEQLNVLAEIPLYPEGAVQQMFNQEPYAIPDIKEHLAQMEARAAFLESPWAAWLGLIAQHYRAYLGIPLVIEGEIYGVLGLYYLEPRPFNDEEIKLGMDFANQTVLAIQNARLRQAEQDRQRELQMLLDVAETANSSLELDETLVKTLDLVVDLIGASRAGVVLLDEKTGSLASTTLRPERAIDPQDMAAMLQACEGVAVSGEALYVAPDAKRGLAEPGALLPLCIREQVVGVFAIIGTQGGEFSGEQMTLFKSIADQLGVAIDNARLFQQAEKAAVTAERNRLARDLHDAVTQTLFSSSLIADVLPTIWERNPEEGMRRLEELRQLTRGALSEMRTLLVELRPAALVDIDLGDLIGHQVKAFIARTRLAVAYTKIINGNPPPAVKEVFYRVAQEAFNNIAKHAEAATISVDLNCQPEDVQLVITDNGCGFVPDEVPADRLGLGIMGERAQGINAHLSIKTKRDQGTTIRLTWTFAEKE